MLVEDQRFLHEDLERLEQAISDRVQEDPRNIRERLTRDHQVADFLDRISQQSQRLIDVYRDEDGGRLREIQAAGTGDPFESFYSNLNGIKDFHRRYPNEPVENLERSYKRKPTAEGESSSAEIDNLFTGEEAYGRFFDLTSLHEQYLNLPGVQNVRRYSYLQYLDFFDVFTPPQCVIKRPDKLRDEYFQYITELAAYLESFMRRTRPLEPLDKIFQTFDNEFDEAWNADKVPGWSSSDAKSSSDNSSTSNPSAAQTAEGTGTGIWCPPCAKEFSNQNVYNAHLTGKKHRKAAEAVSSPTITNGTQPNGTQNGTTTNGTTPHPAPSISPPQTHRLKERAIAHREHTTRRLAAAMSTPRADTKVNVERRAGMTERERAQELEALYADPIPGTSNSGPGGGEDDEDEDEDAKIANPLKLPLDWTGKPIPYWLYKLHGLGVEYPCEICGNFVYMGRRAFDKHFNEARHVWGLKCLGISNTGLFREITSISEAVELWGKVSGDRARERKRGDGVVEMEDGEGNVMPERVYYDLLKQGLV